MSNVNRGYSLQTCLDILMWDSRCSIKVYNFLFENCQKMWDLSFLGGGASKAEYRASSVARPAYF